MELEDDATALEAIHLQLSWVSRQRLEQDLEAYHLTAPQFMVLRCIEENEPGCSMSMLAQSSHQVSATMTGIVDRLVEHGLVNRQREAHDRRSLRITLTKEGRALIEKVNENKRAWMRHLLSGLDAEERQALIQLSRRYLEMMEQANRPASEQGNTDRELGALANV